MSFGEVKLRDLRIKNLIKTYEATYKSMVTTIVDATTAGKINKARVMATIRAQLTDLGVNVDKWVKSEIPQYYLDGANQAVQQLTAMGIDLTGPKGLVPINKEAIATLVDSTNQSFAAGLTGIARNAQTVVNQALKQQISFTIADGKLSGDALKTVKAGVVQNLQDSGLSAITDRAGREWSFDRYAEMLVRTKAVESRNAGLADKMLQNGFDLVQVSNHGSSHAACAEWEGQILSITGNTPGYPTTDEAESSGLMHPNCQHAYNTIEPDLADLTVAYDNPYNWDDQAASEDALPYFKGPGAAGIKPKPFSAYRGNSFNDVSNDQAEFGRALYLSRDKSFAADYGSNVSDYKVYADSRNILKINSQAEYSKLIMEARKAYGDDLQVAFPAFAKAHNYTAIEETKAFRGRSVIAVYDDKAAQRILR